MTEAEPGSWEDTFVANMVRARERVEMSQTELARRIRAEGVPCHQQTIQRIEQRTRSPRLNEAEAVTEVLFAGSWEEAITPFDAATLREEFRKDVERLANVIANDADELRVSLDIGAKCTGRIADSLARYRAAAEAEGTTLDAALVDRSELVVAKWSDVSKHHQAALDGIDQEA